MRRAKIQCGHFQGASFPDKIEEFWFKLSQKTAIRMLVGCACVHAEPPCTDWELGRDHSLVLMIRKKQSRDMLQALDTMEPPDPIARRSVGRPGKLVDLEEVRSLREQGLSLRAIARHTGLGYGTVRRALAGIPTTSKRLVRRES